MPWHAWGCMAIAFAIPVSKKIVPGFIVLLGIYVVVYFLRRKRFHKPNFKTPLLLLGALFILHVFGLLRSEHVQAGINEIGIKLSLLAFPLIAWLMPPLNVRQTKNILLSFVYGCLIFIPIAVGYGIFRSFQHDNFSWLSYEKLGIYFHPTYAATYQAMAFFILMREAVFQNFIFNKMKVHYLFCGVMLVFISMLASKAGLIAAIISIMMIAWLFFKKKNRIAPALVVAITSISVLFISTWIAPETSMRVEAAISDFEDDAEESPITQNNNSPKPVSPSDSLAQSVAFAKSSTQLRLVTWSASKEILIEHPLGSGTGDTKYDLIQKYEERGESYAAQKKLNAHNQFLQYGAELGWIGLSILSAIVVILLHRGFKPRNVVLLNFTLLCAMNFLFESFLEVQAGIVFFCFWIMVFSIQKKTKFEVS